MHTLVLSITGVSTPGNRSDITPLNRGRSTEVNLAMFMSFIDRSKICSKETQISLYDFKISNFKTQRLNFLKVNLRIRMTYSLLLSVLTFIIVLFSAKLPLRQTRAKCGTRSTLCWKILNISDSTELFAL